MDVNRTARYSLIAGTLLAASAQAETVAPAREKVELTVYNQDFALVREQRTLDLTQGINHLSLDGVAAQLDPTSVHFTSLTAPDQVRILEQNYEFDLVNYGKLLQKYVGKEVEIQEVADQKTGEIRVRKARLLSSGYVPQPQQIGYGMRPVYTYVALGQPLFEIDGKIYTQAGGTIVLPDLPEGLILTPTLSWQVESAKAGRHATELSYMTSGISWLADYVALVNADDTQLDLTGWITLDNRSGATYEDAKLKLIAGDVHLAQPPEILYTGDVMTRSLAAEAPAPSFKEKAFFEYHLYTLQRPTTIKDNEIKQVEFTRAAQVPLRKRYIYDGFQASRYQGWDVSSYRERPDFGTAGQTKVWVILEFKNSEANQLGIPLPKGRVRLYKEEEDGGQEFVGEDVVDHTPKDEMIKLYAGNAFDVVGERKQTSFKVLVPGHVTEEIFEITVRNHKPEDIALTVREHLYRGQEWEVLASTYAFEKQDAQTIEFAVPVPKDGETKLTYTVRYRW